MAKQFYIKQFSLELAQFQCQKQFHFKQFSLALVHTLNVSKVWLSKTFVFQAILFSQTVLIQTIQFSTSIQFSSIWPIEWTLSGITTLGQSGPGSNDSEGVLRIPGTSSSDCLVFVPYCVQYLWPDALRHHRDPLPTIPKLSLA